MILYAYTRFGAIPIPVPNDGTITDDVCHVFVSGQCHSLAIELHKLTKWPIFGLWNLNDNVLPGPAHCVVKSPKGFLDINGLGAVEKMQGAWKTTNVPVRKLTAKEIRDNLDNWGYLKPVPAKVKPFAKSLLKEYKANKFHSITF